MKNSLRILFGVSALALLFAAAPVLAAEVNVNGENVTTGADSDNDNKFDVDEDVDVDVDNDGDVKNRADVDGDTGHNDSNRNTNAGSQTSGDVDASADWESVVNAGASLVGADADGGLSVTGDFLNDTTGADSDNKNKLDVDHNVDLDLDNVADILNKLDFDADTGHNDQNRNTNAGDQETGDGIVDAMFSNWANNDTGFAGAAGSEVVVDVTGENNTTGADSNNKNKFDIDSDYTLDIDNDADIKNKVDVDIDTGHNDQNKNTNAGDQETGDAEVVLDFENVANTGSGMVGAGDGGLEVTADFVNDTTGADSDNKNKLNVDHDVDVTVDNDADIKNKVDVVADTGHNDQNKNTNAGDQETGDVSVTLNITNEVN